MSVISQKSLKSLREANQAITQKIEVKYPFLVEQAEAGITAARAYINANIGKNERAASDPAGTLRACVVGEAALRQLHANLNFWGFGAAWAVAAGDVLEKVQRDILLHFKIKPPKEEKQK